MDSFPQQIKELGLIPKSKPSILKHFPFAQVYFPGFFLSPPRFLSGNDFVSCSAPLPCFFLAFCAEGIFLATDFRGLGQQSVALQALVFSRSEAGVRSGLRPDAKCDAQRPTPPPPPAAPSPAIFGPLCATETSGFVGHFTKAPQSIGHLRRPKPRTCWPKPSSVGHFRRPKPRFVGFCWPLEARKQPLFPRKSGVRKWWPHVSPVRGFQARGSQMHGSLVRGCRNVAPFGFFLFGINCLE